MRRLSLLAVACLPRSLKPWVYRRVFGYRIGRHVRIGLSLIDGADVEIGDHVSIGHLNRFQDVPVVRIGAHSSIGHSNVFVSSGEFTDPRSTAVRGNRPALLIGEHVGIAQAHHFDVNDTLTIGDFTTIAGKASQFFTHYVDVRAGTNGVKPVSIGRYTMIGSAARCVPGSVVPDYAVVGMGTVVTKAWNESYIVLGGSPARIVSRLSSDAAYFRRTQGWIGRFAAPPASEPGRPE